MPPDAFALADETVVEALVLSMPAGPQGSCGPESLFAFEACSSATLIEEVTNVRTNIPDQPESISFSIASATVPPQGCFVDWLVEDISAQGAFLSHDLPWSGSVYLPGPAVEFDIVQEQVLTDVKVPRGFPRLDPGKLRVSAFLLDASGTPRTESRYTVDPITVAVNLDCTCFVKQLGMGVVAEAGGVQGAYQAQITNVSQDFCTYNWELRQTGQPGRANLRIPVSSGVAQLIPDEVFDLQLPVFVDLPTEASEEAQLQLQVWDETGKTCEWDPAQPKKALVRNDLVCVIPSGEAARFLPHVEANGWSCRNCTAHPGLTIGMFGAEVGPLEANFKGQQVREILFTATASDRCHAELATELRANGGEPMCSPIGSQRVVDNWTVRTGNTWQIDGIGMPSGCIDEYRSHNKGAGMGVTAPDACNASVRQDMAILCFGSGQSGLTERLVTYAELGELTINWNGNSVWSSRTQAGGPAATSNHEPYP